MSTISHHLIRALGAVLKAFVPWARRAAGPGAIIACMRKVLLLSIAFLALALCLWFLQGNRPLDLKNSIPGSAQGGITQEEFSPGPAASEQSQRTTAEPTLGETLDASPVSPLQGPWCSLRGRVVDGNLQPVADVKLMLYARQAFWSADFELLARERSPSGDPMLTTMTAQDGTFALEAPLPAPIWIILDLAPSGHYRTKQLDFGPGPFRRAPLQEGVYILGDLLVESAGEISGIVLDGRGLPYEGAFVRAESLKDESNDAWSATGQDGLFSLPNLAPGPYNLRVSSRGSLEKKETTVRVVAGRTTVLEPTVLTVRGDWIIAGRAVDERGAPATRLSLEAFGPNASEALRAATDETGSFCIQLQSPLMHRISVRASERWVGLADTQTGPVEVAAGTRDLQIVAKPRTPIRFIVQSADNAAPVETFGISLERRRPVRQGASPPDLRMESHPGGIAEIPCDPAISAVTVDAAGFAPFEGEVVLDAGLADTQSIPLVREGVLTGIVRIGGVPAKAAQVTLCAEGLPAAGGAAVGEPGVSYTNHKFDLWGYAGRARRIVADNEGFFRFARLAAGTYALELDHPDGAHRYVREVRVPIGGTVDLGQIEMAAAATVIGRLLVPHGESPAAYLVWLHPALITSLVPEPNRSRCAWPSGSDGRFEFHGLPAAEYFVAWQPDTGIKGYTFGGTGPETTKVYVVLGAKCEVLLDASAAKACTLSLHILRDGAPLVDVQVRAAIQRRITPGIWEESVLGISDEEGRLEAKLEGDTRFKLSVLDKTGRSYLYQSNEESEAPPGNRIERTVHVDYGELRVQLPAGLNPPVEGEVRIGLQCPPLFLEFNCRTPTTSRRSSAPKWDGSPLALGSLPAGTYQVNVRFLRFESLPGSTNQLVEHDLRPSYSTEVVVVSGQEALVTVP